MVVDLDRNRECILFSERGKDGSWLQPVHEAMTPEITAVIAVLVALIGVAGTLMSARLGFKATLRAAKTAAEEAHIDTAKTLIEQREQLERTLAEQHTRTLNERFATAATQLGDDKSAVRLAGVYAMAALADDWEDNRQGCIDVLCAYLRLPYEPDPGDDADVGERAKWLGNREVRHTVLRVIAAHLRPTVLPGSRMASWCGMDFDFTGVVFDGGDLSYVEFRAGRVSFIEAEFAEDTLYFTGARFTAGRVSFEGARFTGGWLDFRNCEIVGSASDIDVPLLSKRPAKHRFDAREKDWVGNSPAPGPLSFVSARFKDGGFTFDGATFSGGTVDFRNASFEDFWAGFGDADFCGGTLDFSGANFTGNAAHFERARFSGGSIDFTEARFYGKDSICYISDAKFTGATVYFVDVKFAAPCYIDFDRTEFRAGTIDFSGARFAGASVNFRDAQFSGAAIILKRTEYYGNVHIYFPRAQFRSGRLDFTEAKFYSGEVDLSDAHFTGCTVDCSRVSEWKKPPIFPGDKEALPGLILPTIGV